MGIKAVNPMTMRLQPGVRADALFSDCQKYRYYLTRLWDSNKPMMAVIGLNPSTASESVDDNTVRKCQVFARRWGHGGLLMLNLFAFRTTYPRELKAARKQCIDIVGYNGNTFAKLQEYMEQFKVERVLAAWGLHGGTRGQEAVISLHRRLECVGINSDGSPTHPLYLRNDSEPIPFNHSA